MLLKLSGAIINTHTERNPINAITAPKAGLYILDGVTATAAKLNFSDGVTSKIQMQRNTEQATITGRLPRSTTLNKWSPFRLCQTEVAKWRYPQSKAPK